MKQREEIQSAGAMTGRQEAGRVALTESQVDVLVELEGCERLQYGGRNWTLPDGSKARLFMPMEFGGTNGSHHSGTATALAKRGLVDRLKVMSFGGGSQLNVFRGSWKGSCHYRITDAGRAALARLTEEASRAK